MVLVVVIANGAPSSASSASPAFLAVFTLIHELGHAVAARATGAEAEIRSTSWPATPSFMPTRPLQRWERAGISFAGPAVQIVVSVVVYVALGGPPAGHPRRGTSDAARALWWAGPVIGLFNLLPILPFDGGNIARAGRRRCSARSSSRRCHAVVQPGRRQRRRAVDAHATQPAARPHHLRGIFPLLVRCRCCVQRRAPRAARQRPAAARARRGAGVGHRRRVAFADGQRAVAVVPGLAAAAATATRDVARSCCCSTFADPEPGQLVAARCRAADARCEKLVALLPRPLPHGRSFSDFVLSGILLRLGEYDEAAHYAADAYRRSAVADAGRARRPRRRRARRPRHRPRLAARRRAASPARHGVARRHRRRRPSSLDSLRRDRRRSRPPR